MKKIVYVDMDGTLVDFNKQFLDFLPLEANIQHDYNMYYDLSKWFTHHDELTEGFNKWDIIKEIFNIYDFWFSMRPNTGAIDVFEDMYNSPNLDVYLCTMPASTEASLIGKRDWIKENLPFFPEEKVIFMKDKLLLNGDYLIDDNPAYFTDGGPTNKIAPYHPYNSEGSKIKASKYFKSWEELYSILKFKKKER